MYKKVVVSKFHQYLCINRVVTLTVCLFWVNLKTTEAILTNPSLFCLLQEKIIKSILCLPYELINQNSNRLD